MKNAAKCDTSCDLQNPVNHQNFERTLRFRDKAWEHACRSFGSIESPTAPPSDGRLLAEEEERDGGRTMRVPRGSRLSRPPNLGSGPPSQPPLNP